jgi:2-methylisocitrate lyase-like PEP mutase family enzyme
MNFTMIRSGIRVCVTRVRDAARSRVSAAAVIMARIDRFIAEGGKGPYPDME